MRLVEHPYSLTYFEHENRQRSAKKHQTWAHDLFNKRCHVKITVLAWRWAEYCWHNYGKHVELFYILTLTVKTSIASGYWLQKAPKWPMAIVFPMTQKWESSSRHTASLHNHNLSDAISEKQVTVSRPFCVSCKSWMTNTNTAASRWLLVQAFMPMR